MCIRDSYNIPYEFGLMKTQENSYKIDIKNDFMNDLLLHCMSPNIQQYVDLIFNKKTNGITIYESFKKEVDIFKKNKKSKQLKLK